VKQIAAVLLLLILFNGYFAQSQSTDATISGIVVDPSGKVIPDAVITILNEDTEVPAPAEAKISSEAEL
jgi:hypothetical protein